MASLGVATQIGFGTTATVNKRMDFLSESISIVRDLPYGAGIVASRSERAERVKQGNSHIAGSITYNPTPLELTDILEYILGGAESVDVWNPAETLTAIYFSVDRITKVWVYNLCKIARATFRGAVGQPLSLTLDLLGKTETVNAAASFPTISLDLTSNHYMFYELALTINSVVYKPKEVEIVIDNQLEMEFFNSQTPTNINETGRNVTISTSIAYDAQTAYALTSAGVTSTAVWTTGNRALTISLVACHFPEQAPNVNARGELMLPLNGVCRKSGSTNEIVITNDDSA